MSGPPPEVSAVVVTYRTSAECGECVRSLRAAFEAESIAGEIVLVDCASGPDEAAKLALLAADVLLPLPENRGYAGGLNAGLARARGRILLLCNADVVFFPGAVGELLGAIRDPRVGAAAPRASWDAKSRILLPPGDPTGFFRELSRLTAGRWPRLDERRFAAFARECVRLWTKGGAARQLVGVVLAARRDVFDRIGRFDERFPFEYEETEWEERVRAAGLRLQFVAEARIRHLWGRSASRDPETPARRELSRRAYRARRYGPLGRRLLEAAQGISRPPRAVPVAAPEVPAREGAWVALSPNRSRTPFAGAALDADFRLPSEIRAELAPGPWYLTVFRGRDGAPLETRVWEKPA